MVSKIIINNKILLISLGVVQTWEDNREMEVTRIKEKKYTIHFAVYHTLEKLYKAGLVQPMRREIACGSVLAVHEVVQLTLNIT